MNWKLFLMLLLPCSFHTQQLAAPKVDRILGGEYATSKQFPWQAELIIYKDKAQFQCSGSLLNHFYILTAGHCLTNTYEVIIKLGHDVSILSNKHAKGVHFRAVKDFIIHVCFDEGNEQYQYDLALIKLPYSINFTKSIKPIELPKDDQELFEDMEATAVGWGNTGPEGAERTNFLLYGILITIDKMECANSHRGKDEFGKLIKSVGYALNKHHNNYFVCGRGDKQSICKGDSGGSLSVYINKMWTLIGVASFTSSAGCKLWQNPQSFVRVSKHLHWINSVMRSGQQPRMKCVQIERSSATASHSYSSHSSNTYVNYILKTSSFSRNIHNFGTLYLVNILLLFVINFKIE